MHMGAHRDILLTLDSRLENVALVGRASHALGAEAGLAPSDCDLLELCVVEAVTNSILHAYEGASGHEVRLHVLLFEDTVELRVIDQGTPMPPGLLEREEPEVPEEPLELPESGRGLFILKGFCDTVDYVSDARGNVLTLVKRVGSLKSPS
jgi:anti-sigma regulatory factor (Ser/Thr protein kinase)